VTREVFTDLRAFGGATPLRFTDQRAFEGPSEKVLLIKELWGKGYASSFY
jgi:hypothetical protein